MKQRTLVLVSCGALLACGGNEASSPDAAAAMANCGVTATITPNVTARTMTGTGTLTCDANATLEVQTCVQWNPSGTFVDIMCIRSTKSSVPALQVDNLSGCGIGTGRMYRNPSTSGVATLPS
jgi:hypothetical protein